MPFHSRSFERDILQALRGIHDGLRAMHRRLGDVETVLNIQTEAIMAVPAELADLEAAVAANTDTGASAKTALEMLAATIASTVSSATDLADAKAKAATLATTIRTNSETLANAILRTDGDATNDPATPPDEGGGPFEPSGNGPAA